MLAEDSSEATNVVRFPSELREAVTVEVLDRLEPDPREVAQVAACLGLALPPAALFGRADEETARHIAEQVLPLAGHERRCALDALLRPVVASAAEACRRAREAAARVAEARLAADHARMMGGGWLNALERTAEQRLHEAAALLIEAHGQCRVARGIGRAVELARQGERWTPHDAAETAAWLTENGAVQGA